mgnify:CR=1 FL=1
MGGAAGRRLFAGGSWRIHFPALFQSHIHRDQRAAALLGLDHHHPVAQAADDPVSGRKKHRLRRRARRIFRLSAGCNRLIRQGAALVTSPEELLEELQAALRPNPEKTNIPLFLP